MLDDLSRTCLTAVRTECGFARSVADSFHHRQIRRPRANLLLIAPGHYATDLQKVTQIVCGPRRHQLPGGYNAKSWMHPFQFQFLRRQVHCPKSRDAIPSRVREFPQQGRARILAAPLGRETHLEHRPRNAIERRRSHRFAGAMGPRGLCKVQFR